MKILLDMNIPLFFSCFCGTMVLVFGSRNGNEQNNKEIQQHVF
jgi:hypothetical protein